MKTEEIVERMERAWHNCRWSDIEALLADIAANPEPADVVADVDAAFWTEARTASYNDGYEDRRLEERAATVAIGELIISALKAVTR